MSLSKNLSDLRVKYAKLLKPELTQIMDGHVEHLRAVGALDKILKAGDEAPVFILNDQHGNVVSSKELLTKGPLVVSFYRGSWCPYCVEEIKALNESYDQFKALGAEMVVISPQTSAHSQKQQRDLGLKFKILADEHNAVGKAFHLVYTFPDDLRNLYLNALKLDIPKHNGNTEWQLPIPARFVIDTNGAICDVKADPDYRYRPEPLDTLEILKAMRKL